MKMLSRDLIEAIYLAISQLDAGFKELIQESNNKKYLITGETYPQKDISMILEAICVNGNFDTIFIEQLKMLKNTELLHDSYLTNYERHGRILESAISKNMRILGIEGKTLSECSNYILNNSGEKNLILMQSKYVNYPKEINGNKTNLPLSLIANGASHKDVMTLGSLKIPGIECGMYRFEDLPLFVPDCLKSSSKSDFVYLSGTEPAMEYMVHNAIRLFLIDNGLDAGKALNFTFNKRETEELGKVARYSRTNH